VSVDRGVQITDATVRHLEKLASLRLADDERQELRGQLQRILEYVRQLEAIDVTDVEPTSQVFDSSNVQRPDAVEPSFPVDAMLANAPDRSGPFYRVPRFHGEQEPPA
jgi:aspartyl-tRNA(Asn)/glutamyl-tRNA(Gln) amidotransferase subunit C